MITLSKDNDFTVKRDVQIDRDTLIYELKRYFNWKSPTKRYNTFIERFYGLGTTQYDKFINHLIKLGY